MTLTTTPKIGESWGLTMVNNMTFDIFVAIEKEVRKKIHKGSGTFGFEAGHH